MKVDPICPNDDRPIHDGAWLCDQCGTTLARALANIIDLRAELETTILRQSKTRSGGTYAEKGPFGPRNESPIPNEEPAPVNLGAVETAFVVDNTITTWARDLMETTGASLPEPVHPPFTLARQWPSCPTVPTHATARAALLLWRHVQWWRRRSEGPEFYSEILAIESDLKRAVDSPARDSLLIGKCPIEWPDEDGIMRVCGGEVRAYAAPKEMTLAEMRKGLSVQPRCRRCATEADVDWWQERIMPELATKVTASDLIGVIAFELHWTVTHDQIRQWKSRGKIEAAGRDIKGRTLYDHRDVIERIRMDVRRAREAARVGG